MIGRFFKNLWSAKELPWRLSRMTLAVLIGLLIAIEVFENKLIYVPDKYPKGEWDVNRGKCPEGGYCPAVADVWLNTDDGVKIHGWMCTPQQIRNGQRVEIPSQMVILFLHGNAGNITTRYDLVTRCATAPARVLIIDYRGYGKSAGSPFEHGLYLDAGAAWRYLTVDLGVPSSRIVLFGESLGGAIAIDLALRAQTSGAPCAGLIVQSSFTSIPDMAASIVPHFPGILLRTKMNSLDKIRSVSCPKLFIHSRADNIVPFVMGERLFAAAPQPKEFYEVIGARHNETDLIGGSPYFNAIFQFVRSLEPALPLHPQAE